MNITQTQLQHLQNNRCQVSAANLCISKLRARLKILLRVETDTGTRRDTTTTTGALICASLGDSLYWKTLHLRAITVARHTH